MNEDLDDSNDFSVQVRRINVRRDGQRNVSNVFINLSNSEGLARNGRKVDDLFSGNTIPDGAETVNPFSLYSLQQRPVSNFIRPASQIETSDQNVYDDKTVQNPVELQSCDRNWRQGPKEVFLFALSAWREDTSTNGEEDTSNHDATTIGWKDYMEYKAMLEVECKLDVHLCSSATRFSFLHYMLSVEPAYLHIDGHGSKRGGWMLNSEEDRSRPMKDSPPPNNEADYFKTEFDITAMADIWKAFRNLKFVALDFCYSRLMRDEIKERHEDHDKTRELPIVAIEDEIMSKVPRAFFPRFYRKLFGGGRPYDKATAQKAFHESLSETEGDEDVLEFLKSENRDTKEIHKIQCVEFQK